ncbi:hypothetical protein [Chitinivorax sp. B]|uniref:hypothetical protein n=1 Tax=Chitinivorax sp. B TaxID=2502235 RepID=UPI0010F9ABC1|nr:hypothetical protein [Chitinivorax sp. B]
MDIERSIDLPVPIQEVMTHLRSPRLLQYIAAPLMAFRPVEPRQFPVNWSERAYRVALRLFGVLPIGQQVIDMSAMNYTTPSGKQAYVLRDNGHSRLIRRWDHRIMLIESTAGTRYTDHVEIDAGWMTPIIWLFANWFYAHRQRRWLKLVRNGFVFS